MTDSIRLTLRVPVELKERLERLGRATSRSSSWLALDAIEKYGEVNEWQVAKIEEGVRAADAGSFAGDDEIAATFNRYNE